MATPQPGQTKILQTVVTPNADGARVQLQISDAPLDAVDPPIQMTLVVQVPLYEVPLLAHFEREAMNVGQRALVELLRQKGQEIQNHPHYDLTPTLKK